MIKHTVQWFDQQAAEHDLFALSHSPYRIAKFLVKIARQNNLRRLIKKYLIRYEKSSSFIKNRIRSEYPSLLIE